MVYGNSFIGKDFFVLRYTSFELLLYWHILSKEGLTEDDTNSCILEVETHFYFYLNAIYNLKEKFESLVGMRKGRIADLILNANATGRLEALYDNAYSGLSKACTARGHIVHGIYGMEVLKEKGAIVVYCSPYDLLPADVYGFQNTALEFSLSDREILQPVRLIHDLTESVLEILANLDNVDAEKLALKFIKHDREKGSLSIGF
jgi:hypothetical protein